MASRGQPGGVVLSSVLERHPDLAWQQVGGEVVLLHCTRRRLVGLNDTAGRTWELIDGARTVAQVADEIAREFGVASRRARRDVLEFARELAARELVRSRA